MVHDLADDGHLDVHGVDLQPGRDFDRPLHRHHQATQLPHARHEIPR